MIRQTFLTVSLFGSILFANIGYLQATTLTIVSPGPGHPMYSIATRVLSEALKKIGYQANFKDVPPLRAVSMFEKLKADCYLFASDVFLNYYPSAIKVEPTLGYDEIMVFSKSSDFTVNGWNSIRSYSIGFMHGMDVVEAGVKGMQTYGAHSPVQAFKMLERDRFDIVILPRLIGCQFITDYPAIRMLEPPLEKVALYTYLSSEHTDIAPKLSKALSEMHTSGRLKEITEQVLKQGQQECLRN